MTLKLFLFIALVVGGVLGWVNSRIKRENVPEHMRKEYDLFSVIIGMLGAMIVVVAMYVIFS